MCSCHKFSVYGRGEVWGGTHLQDQLALGSGRAMEIYASLYDHAATLLAEQPELAWGWRPAMAFGWDATAVRWRAESARRNPSSSSIGTRARLSARGSRRPPLRACLA